MENEQEKKINELINILKINSTDNLTIKKLAKLLIDASYKNNSINLEELDKIVTITEIDNPDIINLIYPDLIEEIKEHIKIGDICMVGYEEKDFFEGFKIEGRIWNYN